MIIFFKEMVFLSALLNPGWEVWVPATVFVLQKPPLPLSTFILVSCLGNLAMSLTVDYHPFGGRVIFPITSCHRKSDQVLRCRPQVWVQILPSTYLFSKKDMLKFGANLSNKTTYVMFADFVVILHSTMKVMQISLHRSWKESMNLIHRTGKH